MRQARQHGTRARGDRAARIESPTAPEPADAAASVSKLEVANEHAETPLQGRALRWLLRCRVRIRLPAVAGTPPLFRQSEHRSNPYAFLPESAHWTAPGP
ncbi:hypothetical protein RM66_12490 [Xanthomonas phaseoli pv. phaseoli]|nr:hypothetical protein PK68_16895 [Xanthomonas phaseoli pv. phaseoli]KHD65895.1 hypothetical protein PK63_08295 [Xanthomonas phaseoli pv. phaseoli]KHS24041.1 hypothetical protein RM66_12490 [Xanthomonas phaseoli pv. phaseoli]